MENGVIIGTSGWEDSEVEELIEIIGSRKFIKREEITELDFGISLAIYLGFLFAGAIAGGVGAAIGKDIWEKLKSKFVKRSEEKKHSAISFQFKNEENVVNLNLKSENPKLIEKAFDTIELALQKVNPNDHKSSYFFDNEKESWIITKKGKYIEKVKGIAASTGLIKQGEKIKKSTTTTQL